jgi:serine/threonine protein kinase
MRDGGDLVLGHRLGNGGAATIFAARWQGREVSAKVAHAADRESAGNLTVEADVLARVSHDALLAVLATGQLADGRPYLVLPLLRGEDLGARLSRGPLSLARALEVVAAVGGALTALHAAGVVHRDLKPENVFLGEDGVYLLDLGLARDLAAGTASSRIRGTYDVMAPERLYGEPAGVASEVYELAALAWIALSGTLPWPAGAAPSARRGIPQLAIESSAGPAIDAVLRSALSTVPERRPASVAELVTALRDAGRAPGVFAGARRQTVEMPSAEGFGPATEPLGSMTRGVFARGSSSSMTAVGGPSTASIFVGPPSTSSVFAAPSDVPTVPDGSNTANAELAASASSRMRLPPPTIGSEIAESYRLLGVLGSGGAGTVFAAEHLRLPRRLAIKILRPDRGDPDARARFRREAEIIASLSHPHIVEVFDYDVDDAGAPFMVMELLEGETLRDRLRRGPLPLAEVVELVRQVAGAVSAAHARGVVHRDLKPSNLFLRRTASGALDVKVLDFGISKILGDSIDDTTSGLVLGSPGYAAPEQARGDATWIGPATDVFALAAITHEALAGRRAFGGGTREAVLHRILHGDPDPLHVHGIARTVERVVRAGLARRPDRRPASTEAFATALAAAALGHAAPRRTRRVAIGASVIAASVSVALAVLLVVSQIDTHDAAAGAKPDGAAVIAPIAATTTLPPPPAAEEHATAAAAPTADEPATSTQRAAGADTAGQPAAAPRSRRVRVVVRPSTARVVVDGALVTGGRVELSPGPHDLRATAPGYQPITRTIDPARLGDALELRLVRSNRAADRQPARARPPDPAEPQELPSLRNLLEQ